MRLSTIFAALALPVFSLAAKKGPTDIYSKYYKKAISSPSLRIDDDNYNELTGEPRDYGVVIVHTALSPQFGCKLCQDLKPEWDLLAKSWMKGDKHAVTKTLFGTVDFTEGKAVFQQLKLETAPVLIYYPPTTGPHAGVSSSPVRYEFASAATSAEQLHAWLVRNMPGDTPKPPVRRTTNWLRVGAITTMGLGAITVAVVAWPYISVFIQNRNVWASFSLVAILLFTSGFMYNSIRGTLYVAQDNKGRIQYIANGFSNQYGMESQIVAGMYGVLALSTLALALYVPRMTEPRAQTLATFVWCGVSYGMYSFLMSIFRIKNGGYPYTLPPF